MRIKCVSMKKATKGRPPRADSPRRINTHLSQAAYKKLCKLAIYAPSLGAVLDRLIMAAKEEAP